MPTLDFKGKQFIYAHHLGVPYRTLKADAKKSVKGGDATDGNMIIQGDNLDALKALLPTHAGRVNCIYIDPPYNTGNEGWCYNDKVNSPLMKRWLADNGKVDGEDLERHEKWLCMMWPRLQLLRELLAEDGVIFVSIDDNEAHRLRLLMDEIFGEENFVALLPVVNNMKGNNDEFGFSGTHEYTLVFCKNKEQTTFNEFIVDDEFIEEWEEDDLGFYKKGAQLQSTGQNAPRAKRPNLYFPIFITPEGEVYVSADDEPVSEKDSCLLPTANGQEMSWRWSKKKIQDESHEIIVVRKGSDISLFKKQRPNGDLPSRRPKSLFYKPGYSSGNGTTLLKKIFNKKIFNNPKPLLLIQDLIHLATQKDSIVLDSFAGSGTTAHAVLALNKEDGGNRKFILVECEDYADTITAERVRRVIKGVKTAKDETLKKGLGGGFSFRTLGRAIGLEEMLSGGLPDGDTLAHYVAHTALGATLDKIKRGKDGFFGEVKGVRLHLIYKPDSAFLESSASALSGALAESIQKAAAGKKVMVFAPWKFMSQAELTPMGITFCQLPYALYRLFGDSADVS